MPEIKHTFTGGKMDKDLDERLVKNGEYRDAMNIQVATSEGSDVATAQNILGNVKRKLFEMPASDDNPDPDEVNFTSAFYTVGTIADEINDKLYSIVYSPSADYIIEYDTNGSGSFVLIDTNKDVLKLKQNRIITGINIIDGILFYTDNATEPKKINIERCKQGTVYPNHTKLINRKAGIFLGDNIDLEEKHITVVKKAPTTPLAMELITSRRASEIYTGVFQISTFDEPTLTDVVGIDVDADGVIDTSPTDLSNVEADDIVTIEINNYLDSLGNVITGGLSNITGWPSIVNTKVVIQAFDEDGDPPSLPITNFVIKGVIKSTSGNQIDIEVTNVDGFPPPVIEDELTRFYAIDIFEEEEKLFEFKFPRFAYRYKFEDGEYSPFSPFTQVAFAPGSFDYHPRKGYNLGMTNRLTDIKLRNIITKETPDDVAQIDILFKEEPSPNIYIVESIKPSDDIEENFSTNTWNRLLNDPINESFVIKRETVKSVVPSNQLLRPWDNVPRRALAQEITASRLIYGNYVQNYDLINISDDKEYVPHFDISKTTFKESVEETYGTTKKSVKSLREYQIGVVFIDKYGRETPVISNTSGTLKIEKRDADRRNRIKAQFKPNDNGVFNYPRNLTHFKLFVKETSTEYYNLAMDRYYDAQDDNIWLAFASSDRNKVDIDTFLILKKSVEDNTLVPEPARYKILALENQAPDHIKTRKTLIAKVNNTSNNIFPSGLSFAPVVNAKEFKMNYQPFFGTSGQTLHTIRDSRLFIEFQKGDQVSDRYEIASITTDFDKDDAGLGNSNLATARYSVRLTRTLNADVNFITNDPNGNSPTEIVDCVVNMYRYKVENRPQFDGRFFAKIYYDEVFKQNVVSKNIPENENLSVRGVKKIFAMREDHIARHTSDASRFYLHGGLSHDPDQVYGVAAFYSNPYKWLPPASSPGAYGAGSGVNPFFNIMKSYGYYLVDGFSAFAMFFRRYYAGPNYEIGEVLDLPGGRNEGKGLYHLVRAGQSNAIIEYDEAHGVSDYWEYAGTKVTKTHAKWQEFGHDPINNSDSTGSERTWNSAVTRRWEGYVEHDTNMDGLASDQVAARDTEVWFIDAGPYVSKRSELDAIYDSSTHNNAPAIGDYSDLEIDQGITPNGVGFNMRLGFGGIMVEQDFEDVDGYANSTTNTITIENHFNIGNWAGGAGYSANGKYSDNSITDVTSNLVNNIKFRFREDFNQTVYTVNGAVEATNGSKLNHSSIVSRRSSDVKVTEPSDEIHKKSMAEMLSFNYRKNWILNDIQGDSDFGNNIMTLGKITTSMGGTEIELTACSFTGSTSSGDGAKGDDIDEDLRIYVTDIEDSNGRVLLEGMALEKYQSINSTSRQKLNHSSTLGAENEEFLVVRRINKIADSFYELKLGGYTRPLKAIEHSNLAVDNKPKIGSTYKFCQVGMNGYSHNSEFNINTISRELENDVGCVGAVGFTLEFLVESLEESEDILPDNPAVFETEPKESKDLDIYYEATGAIPMVLDESNIQDAFPLGSYIQFSSPSAPAAYAPIVIDYDFTSQPGKFFLVVDGVGSTGSLPANKKVVRPDGLTIKTEILDYDSSGSDVKIEINKFTITDTFYLPYFNCYSFGNGVESNRIRDGFNLPFISNGVKVSTVLEGDYEEERRKYGLIYSGIYNSISGVNNLNQFIQGEKITKDVNPVYGSIQKLHTRDSDLIALCEDKILKILAQKDALFNADGNTNVTATSNVLGQTMPFGGEYGISTNPESFASEDYRVYFSDKVRGSIMRLSRDGLTPISDAGMKDWFRDNLRLTKKVIGSYDDKKGEYNVKLQYYGGTYTTTNQDNYVVSFSEKVRGWVSFKSFTSMQQGVSMANNYYTFYNGDLYLHHSEDVDRNTFYGQYNDSSIDVMLNDDPSSIKVYNTLNYEGSQSKIDKFKTQSLNLPFQPQTTYSDQEFYNLYEKEGWYVESIITDKEEGNVNEFKEKEGKWFNSINRKIDTGSSIYDTGDFSFQGIGQAFSVQGVSVVSDDDDVILTDFDPIGTGTGTQDDDGVVLTDFDTGDGLSPTDDDSSDETPTDDTVVVTKDDLDDTDVSDDDRGDSVIPLEEEEEEVVVITKTPISKLTKEELEKATTSRPTTASREQETTPPTPPPSTPPTRTY